MDVWESEFGDKGENGDRMGVKRFLKKECATVCGVYHEHPEADERDGRLYWFDPPAQIADGE